MAVHDTQESLPLTAPSQHNLSIIASSVVLNPSESSVLTVVYVGGVLYNPELQWEIEIGHGTLERIDATSVIFKATERGMVVIRAFSAHHPQIEQRLWLAVHPLPQILSCGCHHSLVVTSDGSIYAWGDNTYDQLGQTPTTTPWLPRPILTPHSIVAVGAGIAHSLALTREGALLSWGANQFGQLGNGSRESVDQPAIIGVDCDGFCVGISHNVAVQTSGTLIAWGFNYFGQLGDGSTVTRETIQRVDTLENMNMVSVSANLGHTVALNEDGQIYAWGSNNYGQLGDGSTTDRLRPVLVDTGSHQVVSVQAGTLHTAALTTNGRVLIFSQRFTTSDSARFSLVDDLADIIAIACGDDYTLALGNDGRVHALGHQLGDGRVRDSNYYSAAHLLPELSDIVSITCGDTHAMALRRDGVLLSWGVNRSGQLGHGDGDQTAFSAPKPVQLPAGVQIRLPIAIP
jgi:alpha-tubulin suppressor-like RCC1 family protein